MARITITEQDNTTIGSTTESSNIVYIPGYSKTGPINEPILCRSFAEFTSIFGEVPFVYKESEQNEDYKVNKGDYEKSWIYAAQLLREGLPVLYERIYNEAITETVDNKKKSFVNLNVIDKSGQEPIVKATYKITAKHEGTYGQSINVIVKKVEGSDELYTINIKYLNKEEVIGGSLSVEDFIFDKINKISSLVEIEKLTGEENLESFDLIDDVYQLGSGIDMNYGGVRSILKDTNKNPFDKLADKLLHDVKFITSGGYASVDESSSVIAIKLLEVAATRGDTLALIDFQFGIDKDTYTGLLEEEFGNVHQVNGVDITSYGLTVAPSCKVYCQTVSGDVWMPGSFIYLSNLASAIKTYPIWLPVAGVQRGIIKGLKEVEFEVGGDTLNSWQEREQSINPIMNIKPYGYCIFGQRTLLRNKDVENVSSLSFANVRILINELKKVVRSACLGLAFESNDALLWNTFKTRLKPTLDNMKNNRGITDYKIIRTESTKKSTVSGVIRVLPIESAENFDITFSLENDEVIIG